MLLDLPYKQQLVLADKYHAEIVRDLIEEAFEFYEYPNEVGDTSVEFLEQFISNEDNLVMLLVQESVPVGILISCVSRFGIFKHPYGAEILWWVHPEARKGRNPFKMIDMYEYWAQQKGCKYIKQGMNSMVLSRKESKRLHKFYRNRGFQMFESSYIKEL